MMLEARKENKVYQITEQQKDRYLKEGFDIYRDGNVVEYTPLKKIKYSDHLKILNKTIEELKSQKEEVPENVMILLRCYADQKQIDVGASTSAKGILEKILEAEKEE